MTKYVRIVILLLTLTTNQTAIGQSESTSTRENGTIDPVLEQSEQISWSYTREARIALESLIGQTPFDVSVKVELNQKISEIPYAPGNIQGNIHHGSSFSKLNKSLKQISVDLHLPDWIKPETRNSIGKILENRLGMDTARGDQISFTEMQINIRNPNLNGSSAASNQEEAADAATKDDKALSEAENRIKDLEKAIAEKEKEHEKALSDLNQTNSGAAAQTTSTGAGGATTGGTSAGGNVGSSSQTPTGFFSDMKENLLLAIGMLIFLFVTLVVSTFLPSKLLSGSITNFQKAFQGLATSIKSIGEAIQNAAAESSPPVAAEFSGLGGGDGLTSDSNVTGTAAAEVPKDPKAFDLEKESSTLQELLTEEHDDLIITMTSDFINQETPDKSVLLFEVVGKDNSDRIMPKLSDPIRQKVLDSATKGGNSPADKYLKSLEVIAHVKTRILMAAYTTSSGNLDENIKKKLELFDPESCVDLIKALDEESLTRLHGYLKPYKIGPIMEKLSSRKNAGTRETYFKSLARYPELDKLNTKDAEILKKITEVEDAKSSDNQKSSIEYFLQLISEISSEHHDTLIESVHQGNPDLANVLRGEVITFQTLFELPNEIQGELLRKLSNQDIGILFTVLPNEELKSKILEHFDQTKKTLIEEQSDIFSTLSSFVVTQKQKELKQKVLKQLRQMDRSMNLREIISEDTST